MLMGMGTAQDGTFDVRRQRQNWRSPKRCVFAARGHDVGNADPDIALKRAMPRGHDLRCA